MRGLLRRWLCLVWIVTAVGIAPNGAVATQEGVDASVGLTGSYLHDARPAGLMFLSLTQTGDQVGGFFVLAQPDPEAVDDGGIYTRELPVSGASDGEATTLTVGDGLTGRFSMTGAKQGDDLALSYTVQYGGIETAVFAPASPEAFNRALADWRAGVAAEAELRWLLPAEADVPPGLAPVNEYGLTREEVAAAYPSLNAERLAEWEWQATVARLFGSDRGSTPSDQLISAFVFLHRFGGADAAGEALVAFAESDDAGRWDLEQSDPRGDQVRVLTAPVADDDPAPGWVDAEVYARSDTIVVHVVGMAFRGDPTADTTDIVRRLFDPVYRATASELAAHITAMEVAADQTDGHKEDARADLDGVQAVVGDLQASLDGLREQAKEPLDCLALEGLDLAYEGMGFTYGESLVWAGDRYEASAADLTAAVATLEQTSGAATDATDPLDTLLTAMPGPLAGNAETVFADERSVIESYGMPASEARQDLDDMNAEYDAAVATADDLMAQGETALEDARTVVACGNDPTAEARTDDDAGRAQPPHDEAAALVALLPTDAEVPDGLVATGDVQRSLAEVTANYSDPDLTARRFTDWGWEGNVARSFAPAEGTAVSSGATSSVYVSLHRFGSASGAADALDFSFEDQLATTGAGEVRVAAVGDRSRALEVGTADGYEVTVYAQQDDLLVRVTTGAAAGDPTDDALAVVESILGRTG